MDVVPDEVAVRSVFDELTADQPDAPPDRQRQVWRRIRRQRMARVVGALAAIAVATVVAVGIGTSATSFAPASGRRLVPAWALPWLDHRNGSVPQSVLDGAVRAWRDDAAIDGTPLKATSKAEVIWYVGQKVANGTVVVVIFETESKAGRRLIAGWAPTSELMHGRRIGTAESSPWVLYQVEAPKPGRVQFIGVNVHGPQMQGTSNPDNWIVVLAAPGVQDIGWTAPGPSSTTTNSQGTSSSGSAAIGIAQAVAGLAVADTGQIYGPVQVTALDVHRINVLQAPGNVGLPGSEASQVPQLAAPGPIRDKPGFLRVLELTGQGDTATDLTGIHGRLAIRARCEGNGPLRIQFGSGSAHDLLGLSSSAARSRLRSLGTIACDGEQHDLVSSVHLAPGQNRSAVIINGGLATVFRVDLGTTKR